MADDFNLPALYSLSPAQKRFFTIPLLLGLVWLGGLALSAHSPGTGWGTYAGWQFVLQAGGTLLLGAGAAFASGVFLGFLFGVPHTAHTSNLTSIADWLLKLLLGAGLAKLGPILRTVRTVSGDLGKGVSIPAGTQGQYAVGTVIAFSLGYFFVWGCLMSYLLTLEKLPQLLQRNLALLPLPKPAP